MRVSRGELSALCRRAFEGLGFAVGDHDDAADMVVWLEQHGLGGVEALRRGLDFLAFEADGRVTRAYEDASHAAIDAAGRSILVCGSLAAELACAKARRKGLAVVKVRDCHNRKLMLGYLARCARRGLSITAFWRNREGPSVIEQVVSIRAYEQYPTVLLYGIDDRDDALTRNHSVTLLASPHVAMLPSLHPDPEEASLIQALEPADLERQSRRVWEHGLAVDDEVWARLKELADRTLVEPTEASRRHGAGEDAT